MQTNTKPWYAPRKRPFKVVDRYFSGLDFTDIVTLHIPSKGKDLVKRYGVYSIRSRGTWKNQKALMLRAPEKWYGFLTAERQCREKINRSQK